MNLQEFKFPSVGPADKAFLSFDTIPELLKAATDKGFASDNNPYNAYVSKMFFGGAENKEYKLGLPDKFKAEATAYVMSFIRSWAPKQEHKIAICAYIMSELIDL